MFKIEKVIFTQNEMTMLLTIWYGHDEIFMHIVRGLIQSHVDKGLDLDGDFSYGVVLLAMKGWCKPKPVEA